MQSVAKKFEHQLNGYLQTINDLLEEQEINPQQFLHMAVNQIKRNNKLLEIFQKNPLCRIRIISYSTNGRGVVDTLWKRMSISDRISRISQNIIQKP